MDFEFDLQGWIYWYCVVLSFVTIYFVICYYGYGNDVSKEKQETKKELNRLIL